MKKSRLLFIIIAVLVTNLTLNVAFSQTPQTQTLQSSTNPASPQDQKDNQTPQTQTPQTNTSSPPPQEQKDNNLEDDGNTGAIKIGSQVVLLNVLVTDIKNRYATGVNKEDLELYEDSKKQDISFFTKQDQPISLAVLVDASSSMLENGKILEARNAVRTILAKSNPNDEICLIKFDEHIVVLQEFTKDYDLLNQQVERIKPYGGTALYDAMISGLKIVNGKAQKVRQALILITDGIDQHSRNSLKDLIPIAQLTGIPCYIIGVYSPEELQTFALNQSKVKLDNGDMLDNPQIALRSIAEETAGRAFFPASEKELVPIAQQIVSELRGAYALGYYPPPGSLDGKYHSISIVSKSKKYVVRARRGYISKVLEQ